MITKNQILEIEGKEISSDVDIFEEKDKQKIAEIYESWSKLSSNLTGLNCRRVNFPEISEVIFCFIYDCWRTNNLKGKDFHSSFDCYNPKTKKTIQIKATSVIDDLTSFGPKSVWDELYFMDFSNESNGKPNYNGDFKVYLIPNEEIYNRKMNANQTFVDQQKENRRPRFHMKKEIIQPLNLEPIGEFNIYDL